MWRKKGKKPSFCTRVFALLLPVFILNLCVLVPAPKAELSPVSSKSELSSTTKRNNKFLLEIAFDHIADCSSDLPDSNGSGLLEELNEVKEDWHHEVAMQLNFEGYYTENMHGFVSDPLFHLLEDARFSPPPEYVS